MQFHEKQKEVIRSFLNEKPSILICSGAKRAGKTYILLITFMMHIAKYRNKGYLFILGGVTQASIRRNILNDLEKLIGREIKLTQDNHFELFGNKVYCLHGATADAWKQARG